ncbi:CDP-alcohol phosphatidyltransferase family protein [Patescibacteria group bacterium]|nr:CDP-alcohol phosphatidyltransferase family protein [Patescibacteria group bacterium]
MIEKLMNGEKLAPFDCLVKPFLPIIPKKLLPNHLTFIRLVFTPALIVYLVAGEYRISFVIFILLAITDFLDGALARLRNQITEWGKVWDPVADKLLVGSVVAILLLKINLVLAVLVLVIETTFILAGVVNKVSANPIGIQANNYGKIKMNLQCFGASFLMIGLFAAMPVLISLAQIFFYISVFFALISLLKKGI